MIKFIDAGDEIYIDEKKATGCKFNRYGFITFYFGGEDDKITINMADKGKEYKALKNYFEKKTNNLLIEGE